jgi:hypothetical protein
MNREDYLRKMAELSIDATPDELRVLVALAERLKAGRVAYGPLVVATDRRDWDREMRDELLDAIVYGTIGEMATAAQQRAHAETLPPPRAEAITIPEVA